MFRWAQCVGQNLNITTLRRVASLTLTFQRPTQNLSTNQIMPRGGPSSSCPKLITHPQISFVRINRPTLSLSSPSPENLNSANCGLDCKFRKDWSEALLCESGPNCNFAKFIILIGEKMPLCEVGEYQKEKEKESLGSDLKIFYRTYGRGKTKVLLIIGLAGTHDSWGPQIKGLIGSDVPNDDDEKISGPYEEVDDGIQICAFDNRGMGRSSIPDKKSQYSTTIMAKDALALLDHLGWRKAHVFGHSMGAMIACKLAAIAPDRISSLALLNASGGGFECLPKINRQMISIVIRFLRARTPEQRAAVDLDTHYTKEYLDEYVGPDTRRTILYKEYVKGISSTGMQSNFGFEGQVHACWKHKMTPKELELIRSSGFPISVIHGSHDIIAQVYYAWRLAKKLQPVARMVELHGGHLVSHERPEEVNEALVELIKASISKIKLHEWSNLHSFRQEATERSPLLRRRRGEQDICSRIFDVLGRSRFCIVYLMRIIALMFELARNVLRNVKPYRVGASPS